MPAEREVFHLAALLVFQSVAGGVPLLPRPIEGTSNTPPTAGLDRQFSWAGALLTAVRSEISSEAEQCLSNLQREIEVIHFFQNVRRVVYPEMLGGGEGGGGVSLLCRYLLLPRNTFFFSFFP